MGVPPPIVHIGYHKTATSWFQAHVYPAVASHRLVDRRLVRRIFLGGDAFDFAPEAARQALDLTGFSTPPILCEEDLSGVLHNGVMSGYVAREVARRLHATLPDARIVLFVRAQPSAVLSWYQQYLREGGTYSVRRYLFPEKFRHLGHDRPFLMPHFSFSQLDYGGLIRQYDALFGRCRVAVLPYEQLVRDRAGLLRQLGELLETSLPSPSAARVNAGFRAGLIPAVKLANRFTRRSVIDKAAWIHLPYWYAVRKEVLERLNRWPVFGAPPTPETFLSEPTRQWIAQRFWESNRWLETRIGMDLRALGYPLDPPAGGISQPVRGGLARWLKQ